MELCFISIVWNGAHVNATFTNRKAAADWLAAVILDFYLEKGLSPSSYVDIRGN